MEQELVQVLKKTFEDRLLSVMLYGSYVGGSYMPKLSDINVLVILKKTLPEDLERFGKEAYRLIKKHKITPLIMGREEFARSADVFPLEYMDIRSRCKVLLGLDETKALSLTEKNLRHQLEHLLRGNILSLRQLLVASRGKKQALKNSVKAWYGSMNTLFRGLIRLKNGTPSENDTKINISTVAKLYGVDTTPAGDLAAFREGETMDPASLVYGLIACLEALAQAVDGLAE
ncbi:MAG: nucleotidyltransferase domain-containing protein [Spirochaetales bacterium]|nr:nucleotidyltransferase domain-containing protein [Spirochaetales bacterium]